MSLASTEKHVIAVAEQILFAARVCQCVLQSVFSTFPCVFILILFLFFFSKKKWVDVNRSFYPVKKHNRIQSNWTSFQMKLIKICVHLLLSIHFHKPKNRYWSRYTVFRLILLLSSGSDCFWITLFCRMLSWNQTKRLSITLCTICWWSSMQPVSANDSDGQFSLWRMKVTFVHNQFHISTNVNQLSNGILGHSKCKRFYFPAESN